MSDQPDQLELNWDPAQGVYRFSNAVAIGELSPAGEVVGITQWVDRKTNRSCIGVPEPCTPAGAAPTGLLTLGQVRLIDEDRHWDMSSRDYEHYLVGNRIRAMAEPTAACPFRCELNWTFGNDSVECAIALSTPLCVPPFNLWIGASLAAELLIPCADSDEEFLRASEISPGQPVLLFPQTAVSAPMGGGLAVQPRHGKQMRRCMVAGYDTASARVLALMGTPSACQRWLCCPPNPRSTSATVLVGLFGWPLEKGVILEARLRLTAGTDDDTLSWTKSQYDSFEKRECQPN